MIDWFNQHLDTLIVVILAIVSGFFTFVFAIAAIIYRHGERITGIEKDLKNLKEQVSKLEQKVPQTSDFMSSFEEFKTAAEQFKEIIDNLKPHPSKPESKTLDSQKETKSIPKMSIQEIKGTHKSQTRPTRSKKNAKKSD